MRTSSLLAILFVASAASAGCVGSNNAPSADGTGTVPWATTGTPRPAYDFSTAIDDDHNHEDRSLHADSYGFRLVGHADLNEAMASGALPGGYFELAMAGEWALASNMGPVRGFSVVDVSDPANPRHVSDFIPSRFMDTANAGVGSFWDVSIFPDGDLAVLSAQALGNLPTTPERNEEFGGGVFLVNLEDKSDPVMESFTPIIDGDALIPVGVHNANPFQVDGTWYVAATTANGRTYIHEVVGDAPERTLELVSTVDGMHDTAVQTHPITETPLLYTARAGVFIWDMSDPANPEMLSFLQNGEDLQSYHETIPSNVLIDGNHYTVAGGESVEGNPTLFTIINTTDPEFPEIAGTWRLPGDVQGPGAFYTFSGHNFDVDRGRIYIGHYHAGVWVVDISNATNAADPFALAFYPPHEDALYVPRTTKGVDNPSVWRATLHEDGLVWATDTNSGIYALEYSGPPSPWQDALVHPTNIR